MLQRIQTIYLLAIVVLSGFTLLMPVADLINKAESLIYVLDFKGIYLSQLNQFVFQSSTWGLTIIAAIVPIIALYTIFQYKNRVKQIRFSVINFLFMIGYYIALFIYLWLAGKDLEAEWHLRLVTAFPLICIVLNYLAIGAIGKDEALVKSLDRLR